MENSKPEKDIGLIKDLMEKSSKFSNLSGIAVIATGFLAIVGASLIYFDIGISISEIHISYAELRGVTASFAMLGDINIAEPGALIGFAGPRVIKETIGKNLPEGFQTSEFLLEKGFLDFIVDRRTLKQKLNQVLGIFKN